MRALLDTSVVIAAGSDQEIEVPDEVVISAVTLCELHHGVLRATDEERPGRVNLLATVERNLRALPVDSRVAPHYAHIVAEAQRLGHGRPRVADALIAATALSHGLQLYTRDRGFERMPIPNLTII